MKPWNDSFLKLAGFGDAFKKLVGMGAQAGKASGAAAVRAADRGVLNKVTKGGYASIDAVNTNKNFNVSGFQRGTKAPGR
jgi:hypothetical protein